jgi:aminoglycoside phosphotransferase family enzyme
VDGHGDLLGDDIFCLDDGPRILDCLDLDDRLRWLDGLDDAAFLAMDLERRFRQRAWCRSARDALELTCVRVYRWSP